MKTDSWKARLTLVYRHTDKTVLTTNSHYGPLMVQKPFYDYGECHTYILHPPGGIANKDSLATDITLYHDAQVLFTTIGAAKFYSAYHDETTQVHQVLKSQDGILEWLPLENIYFKGARSDITLECRIDNSKLMLWDIHHVEYDISTEVRTTTKIIKDGVLVCLDKLYINEEQQHTMCNFHSYSVFGNFFISPGSKETLEKVRTLVHTDTLTQSGVTLIRGLLIIRSLSTKVRYIQQLFITIWEHVRTEVVGLVPHVPRIWAT